MGLVRRRIERAGERLWRLEDFDDLPFSAVAQSLSRLTREGTIERLSKGVYYRARTNDVREELAKSDCNPETRVPTQDGLSRWNRRRESSRLHNANRAAQ